MFQKTIARQKKFQSSYPYITLATNSYFKALDPLAFFVSIFWMREGYRVVCNSSQASYNISFTLKYTHATLSKWVNKIFIRLALEFILSFIYLFIAVHRNRKKNICSFFCSLCLRVRDIRVIFREHMWHYGSSSTMIFVATAL